MMNPTRPKVSSHAYLPVVLSMTIPLLLGAVLSAGAQETPTEGSRPGECSDVADNDIDGLFDCNDPDCFRSPDCQESDDDDSAGDDDDAIPLLQRIPVQFDGGAAVLQIVLLPGHRAGQLARFAHRQKAGLQPQGDGGCHGGAHR